MAHKLLVVIYHVLKTKKPFVDLGADYFDKLETSHIQRRAVDRLEQGYQVTLTPVRLLHEQDTWDFHRKILVEQLWLTNYYFTPSCCMGQMMLNIAFRETYGGRGSVTTSAHWRWTRGYVENVAFAIASAVTDMRASIYA